MVGDRRLVYSKAFSPGTVSHILCIVCHNQELYLETSPRWPNINPGEYERPSRKGNFLQIKSSERFSFQERGLCSLEFDFGLCRTRKLRVNQSFDNSCSWPVCSGWPILFPQLWRGPCGGLSCWCAASLAPVDVCQTLTEWLQAVPGPLKRVEGTNFASPPEF